MVSQPHLTPITKPRVLIVEGDDEVRFFSALINRAGLDDIQIFSLGGVQKLQRRLPLLLKKTPRKTDIQSIGIVRDADNSFTGAFQSICDILQNNGLPVPTEPVAPVTGDLQVSVFLTEL